jgi:FkbM family methyltransferase
MDAHVVLVDFSTVQAMNAFGDLGSYIGLIAREAAFRAGKVSRRMARTAFQPEIIRDRGIALVAKHPAISPKMRDVLYKNRYEVPEFEILRATLKATDRVLEVGGGIGFLSAYLARVCGNANVTMIEANPELEPVIRRNHALNGVAPRLISAVATCGECESATLYLAENFWATSTVGRRDRKVIVPTVNLNRLIEELKPTYLILDVEGSEVDMAPALRLDGVEKLLVELHPELTGNAKANEVVRRLSDGGFLIDFDLSRHNQVYLAR